MSVRGAVVSTRGITGAVRAGLLAIAVGVLLVTTACAPGEETMADIPAIEEAVAAALPRAEAVEAERDTSGTSTGYVARITLAEDAPLSAGELSAVLLAMRGSAPQDAGYLSVIAYDSAGEGREAVDVKAAADELGLRYTGFFQGITVGTSDVDDKLS
ncbi:MAG TPA: hypothetical protein VFY91_12145 [Microbacterium sp.]|nr:hypothetical protein [Microbacterium sp.]